MGSRARRYNTRWRTFSERTLAEMLAMIDIAALHGVSERLGRLPRLLDVACGTGMLLSRLLDQVPGAQAYGVDASEDMLAQALIAFKGQPHVHLGLLQVRACED